MRTKHDRARNRAGAAYREWPFVLAAAAVFCLLATMPVTLPLIHLQLHPTAATSRRRWA